MNEGPSVALRIVEIRRGDDGFDIVDVVPDAGRPILDAETAVSIGLVEAPLDARASERAWRCDLLAVRPSASLVVTDEGRVRLRCGSVPQPPRTGEVLDGKTLRILKLAAFTIEPDIGTTLNHIRSRAATIVALVTSRRAAMNTKPLASGRGFAVEYEPSLRLVTLRLSNEDLPCFTIPLLERMEALFTEWRRDGVEADTLVFTSRTPTIFSSGGDLATIAALARRRDRATLRHYAHISARVVHDLWTGLGGSLVTVAAVEGKALGSGFEAALACCIAVAGQTASFAFPEARFGLFPGMGATSMIERRCSAAVAEEMILSGRRIDARDAEAMGLVDAITVDETADAYARRVIAARTEAAARERSEASDRRRKLAYPLAEALAVVDVWIDAVLRLPEARIVEIERIARVQSGQIPKIKESIKG